MVYCSGCTVDLRSDRRTRVGPLCTTPARILREATSFRVICGTQYSIYEEVTREQAIILALYSCNGSVTCWHIIKAPSRIFYRRQVDIYVSGRKTLPDVRKHRDSRCATACYRPRQNSGSTWKRAVKVLRPASTWLPTSTDQLVGTQTACFC